MDSLKFHFDSSNELTATSVNMSKIVRMTREFLIDKVNPVDAIGGSG